MGSSRVTYALKFLIAAVFAGWLMVWFVLPTRTYRFEWSPRLLAATNSTYFGRQGTTILIFTFPILFIAVAACVYLHLTSKHADHGDLPQRVHQRLSFDISAWRRPLLVRGPLSIVTGVELAFSSMFLTMLIWSFWTYLNVSFSSIAADAGQQLWQAKLESAALRLGLLGNLCSAFLFFPVARGSPLLALAGITSESAIKYHIWLGHIVMLLFTAHGACYIIFWASTNQSHLMLEWDQHDVANVAGEVALLCGLAMWAATFPRIRRRMFELFFYTHQLYLLFLVFYLLHVGIGFFGYILPGVYLFAVDRYLRFLQSRTNVRLASARLLPSEAIELNFAKLPGLKFHPLSTIFVNVPSVSRLEWHPFTVTSSSSLEPERLSVVIKKEGSWTEKLFRQISTSTTSSSSQLRSRLAVSVEGPYSVPSQHFLRYGSLVMISGGSGITPFISIIREMIHRSTALNAPTPKLLLVCAFRTTADLSMLDLLLPATGHVSDLSSLQLQIEAYVTREKEPLEGSRDIRTVCFEPSSPSDAPIAPVLGPNSWLWLAGIVSSSFVAFLVLIGILQRFYIYPIDHNTNQAYPYPSRSLLNLLFICLSIVAAATAAFLWNKRRSAKEANQIKNAELPTPMTSPSSWLSGGGGRELESLPEESLVKGTTVHYGSRPALKKILINMEEERVGVLVSGPLEMQREVAGVCSSGLANNLHFESISFTW